MENMPASWAHSVGWHSEGTWMLIVPIGDAVELVPFPKPDPGKTADKVINDYGDDATKVYDVDD